MRTKMVMMVAAAVLTLLAGNVQARGNVDKGADLSNDCIDCHGMDGKGDFETPPIVGLDEAYILRQLKGFCSGTKKSLDGMMHTYTEDRSEQDLQDLAAYWATRKE